MVIVLPWCSKDAALCRKSLQWMYEMHGAVPFDCLLSHDNRDDALLPEIKRLAEAVFRKVHVFRFEAWGGEKMWPYPQNWSFQCTARHVREFNEPWLWLEADAIPIKPNWIQT